MIHKVPRGEVASRSGSQPCSPHHLEEESCHHLEEERCHRWKRRDASPMVLLEIVSRESQGAALVAFLPLWQGEEAEADSSGKCRCLPVPCPHLSP